MNPLLKPAVFTIILFAAVAVRAAEGDWYVAPSVAYFDDDPDRKINDEFSGGQVLVGREMGRNFRLEGLLGYHDIGGFPDQEHLEIGINAAWNFLPDSLFSPYAIGGLGYLRADVGDTDFGGLPPAGSAASSATATAGLGLLVHFGDSPWALRTEWRARHAFDDSLTDQLATIGLQYSFGGGGGMVAATAFGAEAVDQTDSDGDGVPDYRDACRNTPAGTAVTSYGCVADEDRDGVTDDRDRCPGTWGAEVDAAGCEKLRLKSVYFDTASAVLTAHARGKLDETVAILKQDTSLQVDIAGHADSRGPEEFNLQLSIRRAEAVRDYLVRAGIAASRLTANGYGEARPIESNDSVVGQADNRRVELHAMGR